MKFRRAMAAVLLLGLVMVLVGCSSSGGSTGGGYSTPPAGTSTSGSAATGTTVVEKGFAFSPATLDVKVGDTVTFKNEDSAPHNVKIDGKELGSQDPGASVTWTASAAGSFPYSCTIHPSMTGEIVVK
jgi:plastocyanin